MNIFFGIRSDSLNYKLTIPKFQSSKSIPSEQYNLYKITVVNEKWQIDEAKCESDHYFYYVNSKFLDQKTYFFFLAKNSDLKNQFKLLQNKLLDLNDYTDTFPTFRCNIRIYNSGGGFSSYQGEYPFSMVKRKRGGSVIAPLGLLGNKDAENKIYIPNIIDEPKIEKYDLYFVDIKKKKVLYNEKIYTNQVNEIELKNEFIEPSVFLCTKDYLGIPIFVSQKDSHLSMEHTHPTHENILSNDRFSKTNELKNKINEIIN